MQEAQRKGSLQGGVVFLAHKSGYDSIYYEIPVCGGCSVFNIVQTPVAPAHAYLNISAIYVCLLLQEKRA